MQWKEKLKLRNKNIHDLVPWFDPQKLYSHAAEILPRNFNLICVEYTVNINFFSHFQPIVV